MNQGDVGLEMMAQAAKAEQDRKTSQEFRREIDRQIEREVTRQLAPLMQRLGELEAKLGALNLGG